ncbi:cyclin-like protein [Apiospora arundinis]|uniref:General transcription factor TFIIB n=1 Tax=Apiospora arundinis TaxID=335852 RepID=A0ABR2I0I8_9PEZI
MDRLGAQQPEARLCDSMVYKNDIQCPECLPEDGYEIVEDFHSGDRVCSGCGLVLENIIDERAEWRSFNNDDGVNQPDRSRCGEGNFGYSYDPFMQFGTMIGDNNKSKALAKAEKRTKDWEKTRLTEKRGQNRISEFCDTHQLSEAVKEQTTKLYHLTQKKRVFQCKAKESALLGALVFVACRQLKQPRTFREVHSWTGAGKHAIATIFREVEQLLRAEMSQGQKRPVMKELEEAKPVATKAGRIQEPVSRFVGNLCLTKSFLVEKTAIQLAEKAETLHTSFDGRAPSSLAAAYLCMASYLHDEPRTCNDVAKRCGVGKATVKFVLGEMVKIKDQLVDKQWKGVDISRLESIL